jgi:hypothetical protein
VALRILTQILSSSSKYIHLISSNNNRNGSGGDSIFNDDEDNYGDVDDGLDNGGVNNYEIVIDGDALFSDDQ